MHSIQFILFLFFFHFFFSQSLAKQLTVLAEWMNSILPDLNLPEKPSSEELRACLIDGTVLLQILSRLRASSVNKVVVMF